MLIIKGIYLLFSHLPTSHTTVHAVPHTAVSCFLISRCVASCFQPSLWLASLLFYCRIPSYRLNREFLSDIWLQKSLRVAVIYFALPDSALPHRHTCLRYYGFCWLLTASFTPSWYIEWIHLHSCVRETSPVKRIIFPSYTHLIYHLWFRVVIGLWCFSPSHPHI